MALSANSTDLPTLPVMIPTQSFSSGSTSAKPLAAAFMKDRVEPDANQCFSDLESPLDPSSATPSSTEGPTSSRISSFSDLESSCEEPKISSATFDTGPKIDMEDTKAETDMPSLKGAGKSDCAVYVVGFHECEKDVPVASLSDESSGDSP
jgi:hypothetical protein